MHDQAQGYLLELVPRVVTPEIGQDGEPALVFQHAQVGLETALNPRILDRLLCGYSLTRVLNEDSINQGKALL